jgi:hypothetical protein
MKSCPFCGLTPVPVLMVLMEENQLWHPPGSCFLSQQTINRDAWDKRTPLTVQDCAEVPGVLGVVVRAAPGDTCKSSDQPLDEVTVRFYKDSDHA